MFQLDIRLFTVADRIRLGVNDAAVSRYRADVMEVCESMDLVLLTPEVLERAREPFPTMVASLDAIHLTSAILVRHRFDYLVMATRQEGLALAGRAEGFEVHG